MTEKWIVEYMMKYGPFAVLFVGLLLYVLRQNERRENRLIGIIECFSPILKALQSDVCEIKEHIGLPVKKGE